MTSADSTPRVCAIILDFFGSESTQLCLNSLRNQGVTSALIVDNSRDIDAHEQLKRVVEEFTRPGAFPIQLLRSESNLGFAAGMNRALSWLEANEPHDYYLLLNNDAQAEPDMVDALVGNLRVHPEIEMVAPTISTDVRGLTGLWYQRATGLIFTRPILGGFHYLTGCCLLMRRSLAREPLFDEEFFMYGEDVQLCWRLSREGRQYSVVTAARVKHNGTGSSRQGKFFYEFHTAYAHKLLARKMATRGWQITCFTAARWVTLSLRALLRSLRYRSTTPLCALVVSMFNRHPISVRVEVS